MRKPTRVLAYCRVSSRDQGDRGTSLEGQRERLFRWCAEHGYPAPTAVYTEIESGGEEKREKRAELDRLLAEARAGDLVVAIAVDRWTRDVVAGVGDVRALLARGAGWQAIDEGIDATTDAGMTALEHRAAGAAAERRSIRRRTIGARDRLRDQGFWVEGQPPCGYRRGDRAARRQLYLEIVPAEAALVREAFERSAAGASVVDVLAWWNETRGTEAARFVIWRLLRNRALLGEVLSSKREWIRGKHEPIITRDLFERVRAGLQARRKGAGGPKATATARTAGWLLRGLGSCPECGARMSAAYSRNCVGYYACATRLRLGTCQAAYAAVERADARANDLGLARLVELRVELARVANGGGDPKPPVDFAAKRSAIAAKLARAEAGWIEGILSDDGLRRARARLDEELGRVEVAAGAATRLAQAGDPLVRRRALAQVGRVEEAWGLAPVELRRAALGILAAKIRIHHDDVEIQWRTAEELASTSSGVAHLFAGTDDVPPGEPVEPPSPRPRRGRR